MSTRRSRRKNMLAAFQARYPYNPAVHPADDVVLVRSPGRVNLIGEHTDYNDGFVMPLAISRDILLAGRRRSDDLVRVYSLNVNEETTFSLADVAAPPRR